MGILIVFALAIKALQDSIKNPHVEELNERVKADNFVIPLDTVSQPLTIKKIQGLPRSILNLSEYLYDLFNKKIPKGKEGQKLSEVIKNALMDNLPADSVGGFVPNAIKPIIENSINKNLYYNNDIVKEWDKNKRPEDQYYEYNSQTAILLGKVFKYSPAKIDNMIHGYFGGLGTQTTMVLDNIVDIFTETPKKAVVGNSDKFILKRFFANGFSSSQTVNELYEAKQELTTKKEYNELTEEQEYQLYQYNLASKSLSDVNQEIKNIKNDLKMPSNKKGKKIEELQILKVDIARYYLDKELINLSNKNIIEQYKFSPEDNIVKYNGYRLELTESMKQEYTRVAKEQYNTIKKDTSFKQRYNNLNKMELDKQIVTTATNIAKKYIMNKYSNRIYNKN